MLLELHHNSSVLSCVAAHPNTEILENRAAKISEKEIGSDIFVKRHLSASNIDKKFKEYFRISREHIADLIREDLASEASQSKEPISAPCVLLSH